MFELLLALTAVVLLMGTTAAYKSTNDVLHPLMFLGPLFLYGAVIDPWLVRNDMGRFFADKNNVVPVLALNMLAVSALVLGALHRTQSRGLWSRRFQQRVLLREDERAILGRLAFALAAWGLASYSYSIANAGGFVAAYSQAKGGGYSASGYLSEGMNLSLVAAAMAALSRYRRGWSVPTFALLLLGLLPNLLQGTFGGRRGPLFLSLTAALVSWFITRPKAPKLWTLWPSLMIAALAVAFVGSQRQFLYLGSEEGVDWTEFTRTLSPESVDQGNNFIYGAGFVLSARQAGQFTWGRELAVNLLVRPVPRQLWPTKYEDAGATWVTSNYPGLGHLTPADWLSAVGWLPFAGSSGISISDLYGEFSWGAIVAFYLIGRAFAELSLRRRARGGVWELLYLEALILSIYLATQSFSAFYHRYLILAVPTIIAWRVFVHGTARRRSLVPRQGYRRTVPRPV